MFFEEESHFWQTAKRRTVGFTILLANLCLTLLPFWQKVGVQPILLLIIIYYWALYRPDRLTIEQLILISLIQDGIYAYPLGFSALRLLIDYGLLLTQRRTLNHQSFIWIWGGFSIFCLMDTVVYMTLLSCVKGEWVGILLLFPNTLLTASLYPLVIVAFNYFVKKLRWF